MARTITAACSGETSPASRASAVASCPESSSPARATWRAASARDTVVVFAEPGVGTGEPGVLRDAGLVRGGDQLELVGLQPPDRPVDLGYVGAGLAEPTRGAACIRSSTACTLGHAGEHRVGAVGVEVEELLT